MIRSRSWWTGLGATACLALAGCKNPDDGPKPFVFPAYPVQNRRPAATPHRVPPEIERTPVPQAMPPLRPATSPPAQ